MDSERVLRHPLLPLRHKEADFFLCDISDAAPKADMAGMEHPIYSLSTKPDHQSRRYEHNGKFVEIKPSSEGIVTIFDRDILIYCISQVMHAINENREVSQVLRFCAHDLLKATNRTTNGGGYKGLKEALERLAGTRINTNVITGGKEVFSNFGLIERFEIVRKTRNGRMQTIEIKLSDWVFNAISNCEVLTLHQDYFRLRKPIERKIYEIARKHTGNKSSWKIRLENLHKKTGSLSTLREFRRLVSKIVQEDQLHRHMPDYSIEFEDRDMVLFRKRGDLGKQQVLDLECPVQLDSETYVEARELAPGWDIYELEQRWRGWMKERPRNPDAHFLKFCKTWYSNHGSPY
ncbi:MAG: replication initiator protein A [Planctomycetota bacterium]